MRPCLLVDREIGIGAQLGDHVGRHLDHQVDPAGQQLVDPRIGVGDRAEHDAAQGRGAGPMVFVPLHRDLAVRLPPGKAERPGADRVAAVVLAMRHHRRGRHDQTGGVGQVRQQRRIGRVEVEAHRQIVDDLGVLDRREEERQRKGAGVVVGVALVQHAVEVECHRIGVERRAVMEHHAVAQIERVDRAVLADVPAFRQGRLDLQRAVLEAHETVIEVDQDTEVVDRGDAMGVERQRLGDLADRQHVRRHLRPDRGRRRRDTDKRGGEKERRGSPHRPRLGRDRLHGHSVHRRQPPSLRSSRSLVGCKRLFPVPPGSGHRRHGRRMPAPTRTRSAKCLKADAVESNYL